MANIDVLPEMPLGDDLEPSYELDLDTDELIDLNELPPDVPIDETWNANLAEDMEESDLGKIAQDIIEMFDADLESRSQWEARFRRGMELMGLTEQMDDGAFPGAATVVHPMIAEAVVNFWARAMAEIFPSAGPVKGSVLGEDQSEEALEAAERVEYHMNYQLMFEDEGYRAETSRMLLTVPWQGSAFRKTFRNHIMDRTEGVFVPAEHFIIPYTASSLETAPRYTHRMRKTHGEVKKLMSRGHYAYIELSKPAREDIGEIERTKDDIQDKTPSDRELDARHEILECYIDYNLTGYEEEDDIEVPYIITVEKETTKVLAIYRNWEENDELFRRYEYFVQYDYVPGVGIYGFGLLHLIGGLSLASTGALRAILDASAMSSLQGGFKAKDSIIREDRLVVEPGVYKDVDLTADELSKAFYTPNYKEPSAALYQTLAFLTEQGKSFASITEIMTGAGDAKAPVGTTVALIEQGMKVFSTIHQGLHHSAGKEFRQRFRLNREYMPEEGYRYDVHGDEREVYIQDYSIASIVPVSDPNIFSSIQRQAIAQSLYQLMKENPGRYREVEVLKFMHDVMKVPDGDKYLIDNDQAQPMDPISENQAMLTGQAVRTFPEQDHQAHLAVHLAFLQNPGYGAHPEVQEVLDSVMRAHIAEHLAANYAVHVRKLGIPASIIDFNADQAEEIAPLEQMEIGMAAAQMAEQLTQIPGLPPPPEQPEEAQHSMEMQHSDDDHKQQLQQSDESHKQKLLQSSEEHDLDMSEKSESSDLDREKDEVAFARKTARDEVDREISQEDRKIQQDEKKKNADSKAKGN